MQRSAVEDLRRRVERLAAPRRGREALPFGIEEIDRALPEAVCLSARCTKSPVAGTARSTGAAAALFAAGVAARTRGKVLWCFTRADLFAPSLTQVGLSAARVIYVECGDDKTVLACFEEGLRHQGLGAVVAEVARLSMTASRRLQLAAETSGAIGIAIRRWRRQTEAADFGQPTAAATRWRVTALPSEPLPVPGVGRARWQLELIRCRGRARALISWWRHAMPKDFLRPRSSSASPRTKRPRCRACPG